jgi:hypothetical protein
MGGFRERQASRKKQAQRRRERRVSDVKIVRLEVALVLEKFKRLEERLLKSRIIRGEDVNKNSIRGQLDEVRAELERIAKGES